MVVEVYNIFNDNYTTLSLQSLHDRLSQFFVDRKIRFDVCEVRERYPDPEFRKIQDTAEKNGWLYDIVISLDMRANWIETHDVSLSRVDALNMGRSSIIRSLDQEQVDTVKKLRLTADFLRRGLES